MLVLAPPLNLAAIGLTPSSLTPSSLTPSGATAAHVHTDHEHQGHGHSGPAHQMAGCVQCLAMGGMSLAGAAPLPDPAPRDHAIAGGWVMATLLWDSRAARSLVCRGPPARA